MRVAFLIDGFNLYHSIRDAERAVRSRPQRWLDLKEFCGDYVRHFGPTARLAGVHYFSAFAKHLERTKPEIELRHQTYLDAIRSTGVDVTMAKFMEREKYLSFKRCRFQIRFGRKKWIFRLPLPLCSVIYLKAEEKETDVAIAAKLFELLHADAADVVVVVSGDTDLLPAINTCNRLFPASRIAVLFPYKRHNASLKKAVTRSFKISKEQYTRFQLPDPVVLPSGHKIEKPPKW